MRGRKHTEDVQRFGNGGFGMNVQLLRRQLQWVLRVNGEERILSVDVDSDAAGKARSVPRDRNWAHWPRLYVKGGQSNEIRSLARQVSIIAGPTDYWKRVELTVAFVQLAISYTPDLVLGGKRGEHPNFPLETLLTQRGDCEDCAILAASLVSSMGLECALLTLGNHMALGVAGPGRDYGWTGFRSSQYGAVYYYFECTRRTVPGLYPFGVVPETYRNARLQILRCEP
jgi:transglutaminase-like putative cysteine protease